ncbi:MAG: tripartite tricarboxylate transporter substrate binding protein [Alphaproteobacteria bacterium]|nr:tripartite tricarboxylate transporter substrate binding protein [Alphaproteobacteria bacterium]
MLTRRDMMLATLAGSTALAAGWSSARAQAIDTLQIFVPAAPGGGWDQTGRTIEAVLKANKQINTAQVTNVPGAGGAVGLPQFVNQWKGRQNSLMVAGMVMVGALIANKSPVNLSQVTPIARLTGEFEVIVVPGTSPHKDMKSLVEQLKKDPGSVSWAGGSAGGTDHILVGMIAQSQGVDPKKVAYVAFAGGGPAQAALLGNQVTCGVSGWGEFSEQVKAGKLKALAISADKRVAGVDVPTLKEQGIDVELFNWRGVFAPPGIADTDRAKLTKLIEDMAASKAWQDELAKRDWMGILQTGKAYEDYIKSENIRIEAILKGLGLA